MVLGRVEQYLLSPPTHSRWSFKEAEADCRAKILFFADRFQLIAVEVKNYSNLLCKPEKLSNDRGHIVDSCAVPLKKNLA